MARELRDVAASVHARLLGLARERGEELQRLLPHVPLESFLYQPGRSNRAKRFVLKGTMLFQVRAASVPRATRDLDLLGIADSSESPIPAALQARLEWQGSGQKV